MEITSGNIAGVCYGMSHMDERVEAIQANLT